MYILTISGSSASQSSNTKLLHSISNLFPDNDFTFYDIKKLPLFLADEDKNPLPLEVNVFREKVKQAKAVIISTPEYTHNIPAVLKSALEWLTSSGELVNKKIIAITYTPNHPRGEKAMVSLLYSLKALDANIASSLDLYVNTLPIDANNKIREGEDLELLRGAIESLL